MVLSQPNHRRVYVNYCFYYLEKTSDLVGQTLGGEIYLEGYIEGFEGRVLLS